MGEPEGITCAVWPFTDTARDPGGGDFLAAPEPFDRGSEALTWAVLPLTDTGAEPGGGDLAW